MRLKRPEGVSQIEKEGRALQAGQGGGKNVEMEAVWWFQSKESWGAGEVTRRDDAAKGKAHSMLPSPHAPMDSGPSAELRTPSPQAGSLWPGPHLPTLLPGLGPSVPGEPC